VLGDVLDAPGFSGADFGRGADDTARLLELVNELTGPVDDGDDVTVDGATIGSRALSAPEVGALLLAGASGVVGPPVTAD
jgi:hypothetical protein